MINFLEISDQIATSGQPSVVEFEQIAAKGYKTVINLAMATSDNAIPEEGDIVTGLGMSYVHIPVRWEQPKVEQFELFAAAMQSRDGEKVWVHCALNMRVSAFLYLYNLIYRNESGQVSLQRMNEIWAPNQVWSDFIELVKTK